MRQKFVEHGQHWSGMLVFWMTCTVQATYGGKTHAGATRRRIVIGQGLI
jgi:hypothetical protein